MFKINEGKIDRFIRVIIGVVALGVAYLYLSGIPQIIGYVVGALALVTGLAGHCILYRVLGISTCPVGSDTK